MRLGAIAGLLVVVLGAGCASGGLPVTRYYTLGVPGQISTLSDGSPTSDGTRLAVELLDVATPYDQDRLVYRRSIDSTEIGFYAYHRWAAPLGRLAQAALIEGLEGVSGVAVVGAIGSSDGFDAVLGGRILYAEEIEGSTTGQVRLALELSLRTAAGEELWSDELAGFEPGPFTIGADAARALHRVFESLVVEVRPALEEALVP